MLVATYTNGLGAPECDHDLVLRREMEGSWFLGNQMPVNAVLLCRERETGVYERFGVGRVYCYYTGISSFHLSYGLTLQVLVVYLPQAYQQPDISSIT